jgi:hypothetical protein
MSSPFSQFSGNFHFLRIWAHFLTAKPLKNRAIRSNLSPPVGRQKDFRYYPLRKRKEDKPQTTPTARTTQIFLSLFVMFVWLVVKFS